MRALAPFLLLAIIACSDAPQGETDASDSKSGAPAPEKLYRSKNCITCHGQDLGGVGVEVSMASRNDGPEARARGTGKRAGGL